MVCLGRLLNGLEIEAEPLVISEHRRAASGRVCSGAKLTLRAVTCRPAVFELAGGTTIHVTQRSVTIVPPRWRAGMVPNAPPGRARTTRGQAPEPPAGETTHNASDGSAAVTVCGRIRATYQGSIGLFDDLSEPLVEGLGANDPIKRSFREALDEIAAQRPGARAMVEILLRRCLILLLRRQFQRAEIRECWLARLEDPRLGRAVSAMHARPEHPFTVGELADVAGMSRSVFAARFAETLGQPPIKFLNLMRLSHAARLLQRTDLPVKAVAARVGYSSRSSFTRAFHAFRGVGPSRFRAGGRAPAMPSADQLAMIEEERAA